MLIAHNGDGFDFPVLVNSLAEHSLLQRLEDLRVLFLDSLKVLASLHELKRKGKESRSLSLPSLYYSLVAKDFDAHDALGDCKALLEVLLAVIPGENFVKYGNLRTVEEVKNDISKRSVIRRTVISLQDLPVSKGIKEKLAKAGIGLQQLNEVFAKRGTRGLLGLLAIGHFIVVDGSEAEADLVLIQTFLLYYVNQVILMLTSIFKEQFP